MSRKSCGHDQTSRTKLAGNSLQFLLVSASHESDLFPQSLLADQQPSWKKQRVSYGARLISSPLSSDQQRPREKSCFATNVQCITPREDNETLVDDLIDDCRFSSFSSLSSMDFESQEISALNDGHNHDHELDEWLRSPNQTHWSQNTAVTDPEQIQQADSTKKDALPLKLADGSTWLLDDDDSVWEIRQKLEAYTIRYHRHNSTSSNLVSPKTEMPSLVERC